MPRLIEREREQVFIKAYANTGNATQSAIAAGWNKNSNRMGFYLKKKHQKEIDEQRQYKLLGNSSMAIDVIIQLSKSDNPHVALKACTTILKLAGFEKGKPFIPTEEDLKEPEFKTDEQYADEIAQVLNFEPNIKKLVFKKLK